MADTRVEHLLREIGDGRKDAWDELLPIVYDELRLIAAAYFRHERASHTLQPTALVHEAYLRMCSQQTPLQNRSHFLAVASTQMRRILIDYARRHRRRGGDDGRATLEDTMSVCGRSPVDILALESALEKLSALDGGLARLVELRYFGGLSVEETAEVLGMSAAAVKRGWRTARAFLSAEMQGARP